MSQLGLEQLEPLFMDGRVPYDGTANALNVVGMMIDEVREAGKAMYTQMCAGADRTQSAYQAQNGRAAYDTVARLDERLTALQTYLAENNLAGLVLDGEDTAALSRSVFEQRARISEASAMVHGILSER